MSALGLPSANGLATSISRQQRSWWLRLIGDIDLSNARIHLEDAR